MRKFAAALVIFFWLHTPALASDEAMHAVPHAGIVGSGRLSVVLWDVYDATLYAPYGQWSAEKPFALSIRYFREIEGADIANRSVEEIRKQGFANEEQLAKWKIQMQHIFPDVKNGTELTAVYTPRKSTDFYSDGKPIGSIKDAEFGTHFFNIWLSEKTSEPKLRKKLLGLS